MLRLEGGGEMPNSPIPTCSCSESGRISQLQRPPQRSKGSWPQAGLYSPEYHIFSWKEETT